jgi:hypothetical protein
VGYYKFHKTGKNWDQARRTCEQEGGHLVVINSEAESKVLADLFASEPKINGVMHNNYAFIGFHDRYVEGEYLTIFGKKAYFFPDSKFVASYRYIMKLVDECCLQSLIHGAAEKWAIIKER